MPIQRHDGRLDQGTAADVLALARASAAHDGVAPLGEQAHLDLADAAAPAVHLTADVAGRVAGYAHVDLRGEAASAELVVAPDARRAGLGRALLAAVRAVADDTGAGPATVWAHGDLPAARALAASAGLSVQRELWLLTRDLTDLPPVPPTPPDVVVREFAAGSDEDAWLAVNARAFAHHPEQGRMTGADLAARQGEPWFRADDLLMAESGQHLLAFAWLKVEPGADEGELYVLGVDPSAQGMGLGRLLTTLTLHRLADRGLRRALLYTDAGNVPAVRTYTSAGFVRSRVDVQYG